MLSLCLALHFVLVQAPSTDELVGMLKLVDERMRTETDYRALVFLEQKAKSEPDKVFQILVHRRDRDDALLMLYTKPKTEAGKGYLRIEKNLWNYDPGSGKWDRRTEREQISGTNARRRDFDDWALAEEYTPSYMMQTKLGEFTAHQIQLTGKSGMDLAFPKAIIWIDVASGNVLKYQSQSMAGKPMTTNFYPKWVKVDLPGRKEPFYYPKEVRIFDEVEKGRQTSILVQSVETKALPENIFTKAWLESQSR